MRLKATSQMTTSELVDKFVEITLAQDDAELSGQIAIYSRLYTQMTKVVDELKGRDEDQRRELLRAFDHPNLHVRVQAAMLTLAVAPIEARAQLEFIAGSGRLPYAGDAGMCLWNLDRGVFKPS